MNAPDVAITDMNITPDEERAGLQRLVGMGVELPIPKKQTRSVAGYIGRLEEREGRNLILARDSAAELYPRIVACAIILRDGKVLLESRGPAGVAGLDGSWDLPGGKVECGESVQDAVVREIKEELGIVVRCTRLMPEPLRSVWKYGDVERHWLLVGCVCSIESGELQVSDNLRWHPIGSLPESLLDADRKFIAALADLNATEERERVLREALPPSPPPRQSPRSRARRPGDSDEKAHRSDI